MTRYVGINIPRFNNTFTAMWLIYVGYWVKNQVKWEFDDKWKFYGAVLIFIHFCMTFPRGMALNGNQFHDVITLTVGTVSALYVVCFLSIKIQNTVNNITIKHKNNIFQKKRLKGKMPEKPLFSTHRGFLEEPAQNAAPVGCRNVPGKPV